MRSLTNSVMLGFGTRCWHRPRSTEYLTKFLLSHANVTQDTKHLPVGPDYDKFVVLHFNIKKDATLYKLGSEPGQIDPEGSLVVTRELQCLLEGVVWYRMPSVSGLMPFYHFRGISFIAGRCVDRSSSR